MRGTGVAPYLWLHGTLGAKRGAAGVDPRLMIGYHQRRPARGTGFAPDKPRWGFAVPGCTRGRTMSRNMPGWEPPAEWLTITSIDAQLAGGPLRYGFVLR